MITLDDPMHIFACFNLTQVKEHGLLILKTLRISWSPGAVTVPTLRVRQYAVNDMYHYIHVHLIGKVEEVQTDTWRQEKLEG